MDWIGEFFAAIPDALSALWTFGEGWYGVAITVGSGILMAGFLLLAKVFRDTSGWVSAVCGTMAATVAAFWLFGILPSAWVYFADGQRDLLENRLIPGTLGPQGAIISSNFYQVFRDVVVVAETTVAMVAMAALALAIQKRYPRALAEGEESRPQSGGYK